VNVGRALAAAVAGFFLFFFLALDLVLFGVIPLGSLLVTVLPPFGFVLGAIVGSFVPKPGSGVAVAFVAPGPVPTTPWPVASGPQFLPSHRVPPGGLPSWSQPNPAVPADGVLDAQLPVRVMAWQGDWAEVVCENGWRTWVNGRLLVPWH